MPMFPSFPLRRLLRGSALALGLAAAATAHATLITFDERPWVFGPDEYAWYSNPIDQEYAARGVTFDLGYLQPAGSDAVFTSQYVLGGPYFSLSFSGNLPTFVNLAFSSPLQEFRSTVTARAADGSIIGSANTGGDYWAGVDIGWTHTPYHANSMASFQSTSGIASLQFDTEASSRVTAKFDNLYFGQVAAVPEAPVLALWCAGLITLALAARRWPASRRA